jgi:hypothetical protein
MEIIFLVIMKLTLPPPQSGSRRAADEISIEIEYWHLQYVKKYGQIDQTLSFIFR